MTESFKESEELEQEAWKDVFTAADEAGTHRLGLSTDRFGRALVLAAPGVDDPFFNRAIGFGQDDVLTASTLAAHYARLGVQRYLVHVTPGREEAAGAQLAQAGFVPFHRDWVKLVRAAGPVISAPGSLDIRRVPPASPAVFADIFVRGFRMPEGARVLWSTIATRERWHCFLGYLGGVPVAAATLFVDGDVAYLAGGATLPEARNHGAQTALIAHRLRLAFALGCRAVYSETGVPVPGEPNHSENNMRRLGFKSLYVRRNFVPKSMPQRRPPGPSAVA